MLAEWLARVGAVRVEPAPAASPDGRLAFIEPNIAFSVETVTTTHIRLRVHFSHESMPPWKPHHDWPDYQAYYVALDLSAADVRAAADEWADEIRAFPNRTS